MVIILLKRLIVWIIFFKVYLVKIGLIFDSSATSCLTRYQKIISACSFGCKNVLNFTRFPMIFHNCHPINHYDFHFPMSLIWWKIFNVYNASYASWRFGFSHCTYWLKDLKNTINKTYLSSDSNAMNKICEKLIQMKLKWKMNVWKTWEICIYT